MAKVLTCISASVDNLCFFASTARAKPPTEPMNNEPMIMIMIVSTSLFIWFLKHNAALTGWQSAALTIRVECLVIPVYIISTSPSLNVLYGMLCSIQYSISVFILSDSV